MLFSRIVYLLLVRIFIVYVSTITRAQKVIEDGINITEEDVFTMKLNEERIYSDQDTAFGCKFGNCSQYYIVDHILANLTNNSVINITHDVILPSNITLAYLKNISIIGYNNPTITCHNGTGLNIIFSHDCVIEGITWNGCGSQYIAKLTNPGIQFLHSSNIIIDKCDCLSENPHSLHLLVFREIPF